MKPESMTKDEMILHYCLIKLEPASVGELAKTSGLSFDKTNRILKKFVADNEAVRLVRNGDYFENPSKKPSKNPSKKWILKLSVHHRVDAVYMTSVGINIIDIIQVKTQVKNKVTIIDLSKNLSMKPASQYGLRENARVKTKVSGYYIYYMSSLNLSNSSNTKKNNKTNTKDNNPTSQKEKAVKNNTPDPRLLEFVKDWLDKPNFTNKQAQAHVDAMKKIERNHGDTIETQIKVLNWLKDSRHFYFKNVNSFVEMAKSREAIPCGKYDRIRKYYDKRNEILNFGNKKGSRLPNSQLNDRSKFTENGEIEL